MNKNNNYNFSCCISSRCYISSCFKRKESDNVFVQTCVTYCDGGKYEAKENKGYCVCPRV